MLLVGYALVAVTARGCPFVDLFGLEAGGFHCEPDLDSVVGRFILKVFVLGEMGQLAYLLMRICFSSSCVVYVLIVLQDAALYILASVPS